MVDRAKHRPAEIDPSITSEQVAFLGVDPGEEVDLAWWEDMLVKWFEEPEEALDVEASDEEGDEDTDIGKSDPEESIKS